MKLLYRIARNQNEPETYDVDTKHRKSELERSLTGSITIDTAALSEESSDDDEQQHQQQESKPAFQFIASHVTDHSTGKKLSAQRVIRGTTRKETIEFYVHQNIHDLQRHVVTTKSMGLAYARVASEDLSMGDFSARAELVRFQLPDAVVPSSIFAKGHYRVHISYTAANSERSTSKDSDRIVLREETVNFSII